MPIANFIGLALFMGDLCRLQIKEVVIVTAKVFDFYHSAPR